VELLQEGYKIHGTTNWPAISELVSTAGVSTPWACKMKCAHLNTSPTVKKKRKKPDDPTKRVSFFFYFSFFCVLIDFYCFNPSLSP
jgi:hypothetical protein